MKAIIAWMARHPVASNLLMGFILIAGAVNMLTMKQEVFPLIELDVLEVRVEYQGAAPDEVEEAIVQRIEEQIEGIDGIDQITSVAVQGTGVVRIELSRGI
ncbi:MAG: efflux RND transporter permease subunit, partial [bacterium]